MRHIFYLFFMLLLPGFTMAQNNGKNDIVLLRNGSQLDVKVSTVSERTVEYYFPSESVVNTIGVDKVDRIIFSSGRTQFFNATNQTTTAPAANTPTAESKTNTLAILPIPFVNLGNQQPSDADSKAAQKMAYDFFAAKPEKIAPLRLMDLREVNTLLRKANIDFQQIDEVSMDDLKKILGVDYIMSGKITYTTKLTNETTKVGSIEVKNDGKKVSGYEHNTGTSQLSYRYSLFVEIYKDGHQIYSESRSPFFSYQSAWMDAFQYLMKRSVIYKK